MKLNLSAVALATVVSIAGGIGRANATAIALAGTTGLSATDSTFTDPDPAGTTYSGSSVSFTTADNTLTWSRGLGSFETDQDGNNYFGSAFPFGTQILFAGGFSGPGDGGPITLTFANAVSEFALNIEELNLGDYNVRFNVLDGATSLGVFSASGNDSASLSFEGAAASGGDVITSVVFDDSAAGGSNNLGFGPVTYGNVVAVSDPSTAGQNSNAVPEPSTLELFGIGMAVTLMRRRADHGCSGTGTSVPGSKGTITGVA